MLKRLETQRAGEVGIAVLRAVVGLVFLAHGAQKLFVFGLDGVTGAFAGMGIPLPGIAGPLVTFVELLGGAALLLGVFTRYVSVPLAFTMLVAMLTVHLPAGFFLPNGVEFTLVLLAATVSLVLTGPGAFALDSVLRREKTLAPAPADRARAQRLAA